MTRLTDKELAKLPPVQRRAASSSRNLNDRADGIQDRLSQRHQREAGKLVQNLLDITTPSKPLPTLKREEPKGGIPQRRGSSEKNYQPGTNETPGEGIAWPLIEQNYNERLYLSGGLPSTDGLFLYPVVSRVEMQDAAGNGGYMYFAGTAPEPEPDP